MRLAIATDAWHPQVNGVVRSLQATAAELGRIGIAVTMITPEGRRTIALPSYPDIRLALVGATAMGRHLEAIRPDHVHIATEGPIGLAVRRACLRQGRLFTTSFHTRFPDYLAARLPVPRGLTFAALRWFHNASHGVMVATDGLADELTGRGFQRVMRWSRGVDASLYHPREISILDLPRPIFLSVGRVAVEKNLDEFLSLDLPGSCVVVGDGPAKAELQARHAGATFLGTRTGEDLARLYASADVFVFPSRTDTFGIVLLEALASGLPVAAYPAGGPLDVIGTSGAGVLSHDLRAACLAALAIPKAQARAHAMRFSWTESTRQFLANIEAARTYTRAAPRAEPLASTP
ncbi:glycosyltransferase family 1 protein [Lichenihabitans sp. Uapishka_5]|uniref:glycosyltransferase family 4 protein n=1 Tax=Lichenihabitans sp. Uapishka_5 TaxID=3037302 RepID=UPI0029E7F686|nr:glycosyltransferase family 1 protein [Lichenihabitans sp. Uapishka_5]MDX7949695.1 glycosyltransferase family 1 protein [Lichenihabitans sp. Uapishka_5]